MQGTTKPRLRGLLRLALLVAALLPAGACRLNQAKPQNVILVMVDTLRADYLGAYGFEGLISENLDRLADESIVFRNCFSQSPWTKPAIASMFTSLYPQVHGLTNHEGKYWGDTSSETRTGILSERATTLAERLSAAGFETAGFVSNPWVASAYGFGQGFDHYDDKPRAYTSAVDLTAAARTWLESRDSGSPYFLYLHFMDVHAPYSAPKADFDLLRDSPSVAFKHVLKAREMPDARWMAIEKRPEWATDEMRSEVAYWRARYASGVRAFDRRLGQFMDYLKRNGELDRSLFVFTSDHGEELFEHGDWSHGQNLYDHQLRVPLIVRNPGGRHGGVESEIFVELVDLMPTILSTLDLENLDGMQGRDVSAALNGHAVENTRITFATATQRTPGLYSVRTGQYKLVIDLDSGVERLYDLARDPGEQWSASSLKPDVADELRGRLLTHIRDSISGGVLEPDATTMSPEHLERLRALGYVP
jgi:arylsulfatase A-like enzyme